MAAVQALDEQRFGYLKPADVARLAEAYRFSEAAHAGQTRQSGEPQRRVRTPSYGQREETRRSLQRESRSRRSP